MCRQKQVKGFSEIDDNFKLTYILHLKPASTPIKFWRWKLRAGTFLFSCRSRASSHQQSIWKCPWRVCTYLHKTSPRSSSEWRRKDENSKSQVTWTVRAYSSTKPRFEATRSKKTWTQLLRKWNKMKKKINQGMAESQNTNTHVLQKCLPTHSSFSRGV